ncbi:MAG: DUF4919 domain-containing protein [Ignavibacteria bacterium]|nr:DUF4919 domain-containing protein [Ignavibacteria bacterium]
MRNFILVLLCGICFTFRAFPQQNNHTAVSGAELDNVLQELGADDYQYFLDSLNKYGETDFFMLRMSFTRLPGYRPFSVMNNEAFKELQLDMNQKRYNEGVTVLEEILATNYFDPRAHMMAVALYQYKGDTVKAKFHARVYKGIISSIVQSGDGVGPETAFIVISTEEEYAFMQAANWHTKDQNLLDVKGRKYDCFRVSKVGSNDDFYVYFDVTLPMRTLEGSPFKPTPGKK